MKVTSTSTPHSSNNREHFENKENAKQPNRFSAAALKQLNVPPIDFKKKIRAVTQFKKEKANRSRTRGEMPFSFKKKLDQKISLLPPSTAASIGSGTALSQQPTKSFPAFIVASSTETQDSNNSISPATHSESDRSPSSTRSTTSKKRKRKSDERTTRYRRWGLEDKQKLLEGCKKYLPLRASIHNVWVRISEEFLNSKFSSTQCRNKYQLGLKPQIKKGKWTEEERKKLSEAIKKYGSQWTQISKEVFDYTRTGQQCFSESNNALNNHSTKGSWTKEESDTLIKLYDIHKDDKNLWKIISEQMPRPRTGMQCYLKYLCIQDKKIKFSENEIKLCIAGQRKYGNDWALISEKYFNRERTRRELFLFWRDNQKKIEEISSQFRETVTEEPSYLHLKKTLAQQSKQIGISTNKEDSFYDSFSQAFEITGQRISIKELREKLKDFLNDPAILEEGAKNYKLAGGLEDYSTYLANLANTMEKDLKEGKPEGGKHNFEGKLLAGLFNVTLNIYEVISLVEENSHDEVEKKDFIIKKHVNCVDKNNPVIEMAFYEGKYAPVFNEATSI